jgi:molybdopterin/thiamine biosynthesis adenylyltransferase/rhodanese-related sulfurtransferase
MSLTETLAALSPSEIRRYGRHLTLPEFGIEGQLRLKAASVLVVGTGGLGSPIALYLAAAGVGRLVLVDFDRVEESNLQRQILFGQSDLGRFKVEVASRRLAETNPHVVVEALAERFTAANARRLVGSVDLVLDGTDNFPTRYLINDACVLSGKPFVYGSIYRFEGQAALFATPGGPCYRCLFPEPPPEGLVPNCAEGGVLGVLPGMIGSIQANEALKYLAGVGTPLAGRLLVLDALSMRVRDVRVPRDPACPVCGDTPSIRELREIESVCDVPASAATESAAMDDFPQDLPAELAVEDFAQLRAAMPQLQVIDVRMPVEWEIAHLEGAVLVPLPELESRLAELDAGAPTVVYCHLGGRSAAAARLLRARGFDRVANLTGGIDAWSVRVDPALRRY